MKKRWYIFLLICLGLFSFSCSGGGETKKQEAKKKKLPLYIPSLLEKTWFFQRVPEGLLGKMKLKDKNLLFPSVSPDKEEEKVGILSWNKVVIPTGSIVLERVLEGHRKRIYSVAFSPDGKTLASGSEDGTIRLWSTLSGKELLVLKGHKGGVHSVAFSPDGKTLASGSEDHQVKLWDLSTNQVRKTLKGHEDIIFSVAFSPDGKTLASASWDTSIRLWKVESFEPLRVLKANSWYVFSVAFSPDGKTLASGNYDRSIRLWDIETGEILKTLQGIDTAPSPEDPEKITPDFGHSDWVHTVAFSPDGKLLASGSEDKTVRLWDLQKSLSAGVMKKHTSFVKAVAFSEKGTVLASASGDGTVCLWDTEQKSFLKTLNHRSGRVDTVAFSRSLLASAGTDKNIYLWRIQAHILHLPGQPPFMTQGITLSPDQTLLIAQGMDGKYYLFDTREGDLLSIFSPGRELSGISFFSSNLLWGQDERGNRNIYYLSRDKMDLSSGTFQVKSTPQAEVSLSSRAVKVGESLNLQIKLDFQQGKKPLYQFGALVFCPEDPEGPRKIILLGKIEPGENKTLSLNYPCPKRWEGRRLQLKIQFFEQYNYAPPAQKVRFRVKRD